LSGETTKQIGLREVASFGPGLIAIGSLYGLTLSVLFEVTYLFVSGNSWVLGTVSVSDFLDRSVLPIIICAMFAVFMIPYLAIGHGLRWLKRKTSLANYSILSVFAVSLLAPAAYEATVSRAEFATIIVAYLPFTCCALLIIGVHLLVSGDSLRRMSLIAILVIIPLLGAISFGGMFGMATYSCKAPDKITLTSGKIIAAPFVFSLNHGLAIRQEPGHVRSIIQWSQIAQDSWTDCHA
jgi:hypothetical protein